MSCKIRILKDYQDGVQMPMELRNKVLLIQLNKNYCIHLAFTLIFHQNL